MIIALAKKALVFPDPVMTYLDNTINRALLLIDNPFSPRERGLIEAPNNLFPSSILGHYLTFSLRLCGNTVFSALPCHKNRND